MRKITLYIAMSLNGKIAASDGGVEWLETIENPDKLDYGYDEFYHSIDTTIQGYNTYKQIIDWGIPFPYTGKKNFVLTRKQGLDNTKDVEFVNKKPTEFVRNLKNTEGGDIWVIGGGQINTLLFNEGLIDELQIFVMPIILSGGIELFSSLPKQSLLSLIEQKHYPTGVIELRYAVNPQLKS